MSRDDRFEVIVAEPGLVQVDGYGWLTPAEARRLAIKLLAAADRAENEGQV